MGETLVPCDDAAQALEHLASGGVVHVGDLLLEGLTEDEVLFYDPELGSGQRFPREELAERMSGVASYRVCPGT